MCSGQLLKSWLEQKIFFSLVIYIMCSGQLLKSWLEQKTFLLSYISEIYVRYVPTNTRGMSGRVYLSYLAPTLIYFFFFTCASQLLPGLGELPGDVRPAVAAEGLVVELHQHRRRRRGGRRRGGHGRRQPERQQQQRLHGG